MSCMLTQITVSCETDIGRGTPGSRGVRIILRPIHVIRICVPQNLAVGETVILRTPLFL